MASLTAVSPSPKPLPSSTLCRILAGPFAGCWSCDTRKAAGHDASAARHLPHTKLACCVNMDGRLRGLWGST